jgi:hypothetical protein
MKRCEKVSWEKCPRLGSSSTQLARFTGLGKAPLMSRETLDVRSPTFQS